LRTYANKNFMLLISRLNIGSTSQKGTPYDMNIFTSL
jgi:hypothetical protein